MLKTKIHAAIAIATLALTGCHGHQINAAITNHTGNKLQTIELDYPSASFGINALANNATYKYPFEVHGSGKLHISYLDAKGAQHQADGPTLTESDSGTLQITITPENKVTWQR